MDSENQAQSDKLIERVFTHLTTLARTKSALLHALTRRLATTPLHLAHSSAVGADGNEIKYADST